MLKAELHTHIKADPLDKDLIDYSAFELIDRAAEKGFQVLAITCHNYVYSDPAAKEYARKKNIILLFGVEKDIEGKHTLLYNINDKISRLINTFDDLKRARKEHPEMLVIAAHPFHYRPTCLKNNIIKHLDLFDLWEYSFFHTHLINPNRKTVRLAKRYHKPLVGCSDVHNLKYLGRTYTLIDAKIDQDKSDEKLIFRALREGKTKVMADPLSLYELIKITAWAFISTAYKTGKNIFSERKNILKD